MTSLLSSDHLRNLFFDPLRGSSLFQTRDTKSPPDPDHTTQMDWKETRDAHVFEIELPGLTKQDVSLRFHRTERVLEVTADSPEKDGTEDEKVKWHCRERAGGGFRFSRKFRLPENVKAEEIKASMSDGVLTVTVPKEEETAKRKRKAKKVEIVDGGKDPGVTPKGLGRFVCCKA